MLSNAIASVSGGKATAIDLQNTSSGISSGINSFLSNQVSTSGRPKAYINWILFNEQFKYVGGGFEQVGSNGVTTIHTKPNLTINNNGYLYIFSIFITTKE